MESQWQPVMQACMHWLYDTLHSGVLLKLPSSLPFCSASGIMSNNKRSRWLELRQESGSQTETLVHWQDWMKIRPCYSPQHCEPRRNGVGECIIAFKLHEGCFDTPSSGCHSPLHICTHVKINPPSPTPFPLHSVRTPTFRSCTWAFSNTAWTG